MPSETISNEIAKILGRFPNTYTFTKSMAERIMSKHSGDLPFVIYRPSIIGCAWQEPSPGWIDTLAAAGGILSGVSVGICNTTYGDLNTVLDIVPVDFVANAILMGTAVKANKKGTIVLQGASGAVNPLNLHTYFDSLIEYLKTQPYDNQWFVPSMLMTNNKKYYEWYKYINNTVPMQIYGVMGKMTGSTYYHKEAMKIGKAMYRSD